MRRGALGTGGLFELLPGPNAIWIELQAALEGLLRLTGLIRAPQCDSQPQPCVRVLRIQLDGFAEILDREIDAAAECGGI